MYLDCGGLDMSKNSKIFKFFFKWITGWKYASDFDEVEKELDQLITCTTEKLYEVRKLFNNNNDSTI